jgi:UDP-N-acetyl-D-galactosamine dehydrogenase
MKVYQQLLNGDKALAVVGLGYVGMPLAIEFAKKIKVIGYDKSEYKINCYKRGIDATGEVGDEAIRNTTALFSDDDSVLDNASFYIVAVPTPIAEDKTPNLSFLINASRDVGRHLKKGDIVVFESTVYPGVTEEICVPVLEKESGLVCGADFKVGYSPERINPGDRVHTVTKVLKIVSGMDEESLEEISQVYSIIVEAGVYKAESIKVAEAAKVIENTQRDLNIALMNELSIIFNKMNVNTKAVLEAAGTKWNFLKFTPGLVGGHCIGVDPYYLAYKAQQLGYHPEVILAGRRINDVMGKYVAENTVKQLIKADKQIKGAKVLIMGFTFKEDVPDARNTKVAES